MFIVLLITVLLLFSVISGQARVVRASTVSGSGIHLIHGLSSSDSDDDEGYDDDFDFRRSNVPVPPSTSIKHVTNLNMLINNIINFSDFWIKFCDACVTNPCCYHTAKFCDSLLKTF